MDATPDARFIGVNGELLWFWFPLPSWPLVFRPQHFAMPSARTAQVWKEPAVIWTAFAMPGTATGVGCGFVFPIPSWPLELSPQHLMLPHMINAHVWICPAATAMTPLDSAGTSRGTFD